MKRQTRLLAASALALLACSAMAQNAPPASTPAPVGVTPQTAQEANQKAVQRPDTGTVVRTAPPVTQRAPASAAAPAGQAGPVPQQAPAMRQPRADRN